MAGFKLSSATDSPMVEEWTVSSLTLAVGDLLELDAGATAATVADSSTNAFQRKGVVMKAVTSSETLAKVAIVNPDQIWEAESANNSNASHNGDRMALTDRNTVNNSGSDQTGETAVVIQLKPAGAAAEKRILVRFFESGGVNPDAS